MIVVCAEAETDGVTDLLTLLWVASYLMMLDVERDEMVEYNVEIPLNLSHSDNDIRFRGSFTLLQLNL